MTHYKHMKKSVLLNETTNGYGYVDFDGSTNYLHTADDNKFDLSGDCSMVAHISSDNYSKAQNIISKFGVSGQRGWAFGLSNKQLNFWWSNDGTANTFKTSSANIPISNGEDIWVKTVFIADNGASGNTIQFYYSSNGLSWTKLGTDVVTPGVATIFNSTQQVEIGSRTNGESEHFDGKIYEVYLYNENGKIVCSPDFGNLHPYIKNVFIRYRKQHVDNTWNNY